MLILIFFLPVFVGYFASHFRKKRLLYHILLGLAPLLNLIILSVNLEADFALSVQGFSILHLDKFALILLLLVNVGWLITLIYSYSFTRYNFRKKQYLFYEELTFVLLASMLTAMAGNIWVLFIAYVLGVLLTKPLIEFRQTEQSFSAGKSFFQSTFWPAIGLVLPALIYLQYLAGNLALNFSDGPFHFLEQHTLELSIILVMLVIGIGQNAVFPFNQWLAKTSVSPAPVSALIHSIASVKSGSIFILKIAEYIIGLPLLHQLTGFIFPGNVLFYLCGGTAIWAAYKALKTKALKERFAYSTISQSSYILTAILLATPTSVLAGVLHIVTHSISKMGLFFVAGFYNSVYKTHRAEDVGNLAPYHKWVSLSVAIFGLSITGFPFLAGFYSKDLMLLEELHSGNYAAAIFLLSGSVINLLYIYPIIKAAFFNPKQEPIKAIKSLPRGMQVALILCVALVMTSSFYMYYLVRLLQ